MNKSSAHGPRLALLVAALAACQASTTSPAVAPAEPAAVVGAGPAQPAPTQDASAVEPLIVDAVLIDTPRPAPPGPDLGEPGSALPETTTSIGLRMRAPFDCDAGAIAVAEYEGSILGSYGIDTAVTYYVPRLDRARCRPADADRPYELALTWRRRSDTPWTIVVAGYLGQAGRLPDSALFAQALRGYRADAGTAAAIAAMPRAPELVGASLTNGPSIDAVAARVDAARHELVLSLTLGFGNDCEASRAWRIAPLRWQAAGDDTVHVLAFLAMGDAITACNDLAAIPRPTARREFRIALPASAARVTLAVPNVDRDPAPPIDRQTLPAR